MRTCCGIAEQRRRAQVLHFSVGLKSPHILQGVCREDFSALQGLPLRLFLASRLHEPQVYHPVKAPEVRVCQGHRAAAAPRDASSLPLAPRRIQKDFQVFCQERFRGRSAANPPWVGGSMEKNLMAPRSQCEGGGGGKSQLQQAQRCWHPNRRRGHGRDDTA